MAPVPESLSSREGAGMDAKHGERVVISGMSGLYPESHSVKELADILYNKVNPVNNERPRWKYEHPEVAQYTGKVPGLTLFDAQFFKVHYRLSNNMDPMARKVLEQSYQAIYDAGICPEELSGRKVGVYIGSCFSETEKACFYVASSRTGFGIAGCSKSMFANRISYWLNAKGPSMSIDEACCSSIGALELAYLAITRGECESAIVGGSNLCLHPQSSIHYGRIMKLSMDGKTKSFDTHANGCAKSEAINVLFLQRAKDALRVYAEVVHVKSEFTSVVQGETGPKYGFYREPVSFTKFINNFYEEAKVAPKAVEYVEAFGSAVPEVDKVELDVIEEVFCKNRNEPLLVGSVMSNIGYGEASSGISAITKILLGYHFGQLAANLHCDSPRKDVAALSDGRMRIVAEHEKFGRTYTAVNSFSVTGVNAHVLLYGHYKPKDLSRYKANIPHLVVLSGRQEVSVEKILQDLKSRPVDPEEIALFNNIHKTRTSGHLGRGFTILDTNENNETISLCEKANYFDDAKRPLWFVYSGMGSQWSGMGAQLMRIPIFAAAIERCRRVLEPKGVDIVHIITSPDKNIFDNILHSFVGIAAVQIGLTDVLTALGIVPDKIIGHSVGELGCAYADGCFTAEEMILSAYSRGLVSLQTPFIRGSMAAIGVGYQQISKMCPPEVEVACHNGPQSSTISGPADIMKEFVAELTVKGIFAKEVPCSNIAYHSRYIAEAGPGLLKYLSEVIKSPKPRSERWVSTSVPQERWNEPIAKYSSAEYHTNNLLNSVLFEETSRLIPSNAVVVEIAPHGLLQAILKRSLPETCKHIPLTRRGHPDNAQFLLESIGNLYMEGYNPIIQALYPKIEFPVSTGTPMLSHLVEWAHNEKWVLPLYDSANRKTAAACKNIISIHDDEHSYLRGHVIKDKILYPFAATLVGVWDTLAMVLNVPKKQLSVQFRDIHLHTQPVLHDQRQLRLQIALHRGTGRFEVTDENIKVATGFIVGEIDEKEKREEETSSDVMQLNSEDIYQLSNIRDYNYSGEFQSLYRANLALTEADILWQDNWVTLIDGLFQLNALRRNHDTISQPNFIRSIKINTKEHFAKKISDIHDVNIINAQFSEVLDSTRCGGVFIENMKFHDLLSTKNTIDLKRIQFVPHFSTGITDELTSLYVFFQMVAENLNKQEINIMEIVRNKKGRSRFLNIEDIIKNIPGIKIHYSQVCRDEIIKENNNLFENIDLFLTENLATDNSMSQALHRVINADTFIANKEDYGETSNTRPSGLYRTVSAHTIGSSLIELVIWRPQNQTIGTNTVTVFTHSDLALLSSQLPILPARQKLIIITTYPAFANLRTQITEWRTKYNLKIVLVLIDQKVSKEQYVDQIPYTDLVTNILDNGVWGGEYFLPLQDNLTKGQEISLEISNTGDLNSSRWVKATELTSEGVTVKVKYAGLNDTYVKKVLGVAAKEDKNDNKIVAYDFSGTTNGINVMGIVQDESISTVVKARPELLWPVPKQWTLEDAATVPLAYCLAFYCLCIKSRLYFGNSILIHGGTGALGQALISIALAYGCDIFTTVSDVRKKRFLLQLFPQLKEDHIGNSRDSTFGDLVMSATKGKGCDIVISCVKGELRNVSITCCASFGIVIDASLIIDNEDFDFGMFSLGKSFSYVTLQFSSIFEPHNINELKELQIMMSEGIARGYVRPLSRVVYAPSDVSRGLRFQASSRHCGRVLLHLQQDIPYAQTKITCSSDLYHLVLSDEDVMGILLAERLVRRGAKKLVLQCTKKSNSLLFKLSMWEKQGVEIKVHYRDIKSENIMNLINDNVLQNVEGIYYIISSNDQAANIVSKLEELSRIRKSKQPLKYFAIIDARNSVNKTITIKSQVPITVIKLPTLIKAEDERKALSTISVQSALDAVEKALSSNQRAVVAHNLTKSERLLQDVAAVAGVTIPEEISQDVTLQDLGMDPSNLKVVQTYLRDVCNLSLDENIIPTLTIQKIHELEDRISGKDFKETEDLSTFFSYIDLDELLATIEMVFIPTLTTGASMRDDEFDVNRTYLCIVPGVEGLHARFRELCERVKLPALVLQPGLERQQETIQEMAQRFSKILLKRTRLHDRFYLLGYESGVLVALEMAAILEEHGLTGKIFCIGGGPNEVQATFERKLSKFNTEESLQIAVARHMFSLITNNRIEILESELQDAPTWKEKVSLCIQKLLGCVEHSTQYAQELIEAAYARIVQARRYQMEPKKLRSILISLLPRSESVDTEPLSIHDYSQHKVIEYKLEAPLAYAANDLRCAAIINRHLDKDLLEEFEKQNMCETYIVNVDSFMTAADEDME